VLQKDRAYQRGEVLGSARQLVCGAGFDHLKRRDYPGPGYANAQRLVQRETWRAEHQQRRAIWNLDARGTQGRIDIDGDLEGKDIAGLAHDRAQDRVVVNPIAAPDRGLAIRPRVPCEAEMGPKVPIVRVINAGATAQHPFEGVDRAVKSGGPL